MVGDVSDVSLIGVVGEVQITCAPGLGLAFLNVTRLSLQGLNITGCGLNGSNVATLNSAINTSVDLFIQLPEDINIAAVIAICTDVVVDHVTIVNTTGLGLVGVNVAGQSNFTNNVFSFNKGQQCFWLSPNVDQSRSYTVGGGASFIYVDFIDQSNRSAVNLNIDNNTFSYNSYCGLETYVQLNYQYFEIFRSLNYTIGSGGGLSLNLAQQRYALNINVQRSYFENNTATYGSAASIYWYAGLQDTHINFSDCNFTKNGLAKYNQSVLGSISYLTQGGVIILKDIVVPSRPFPGSLVSPNTVMFLRTTFTSNSGSLGSGVMVTSQYSAIPNNFDTVVLDSCHFEGNIATAGPALYISENKHSGLQVGLVVTIQNCTFVNNTVDQSSITAPSGVYAVVQAAIMNLTIRDSSFLGNRGTAVGGIASLVTLEGAVEFNNNKALAGGALNLISSTTLLIKQNSAISFINNTATISGGAIYVDYSYGDGNMGFAYDCFLQFESIYVVCTLLYPCPDLTAANISMMFYNNKATLGGMLYGSTLDVCPWAAPLKQQLNLNASILEVMYERKVIIQSDRSPNTPSVVSTPVSTLAIKSTSFPSYMPGQRFNLELSSSDRLGQDVPTVVTAQALTIKLGDSGFWLTSLSSAGTKVYGQQNTTMNITLYTLDSYVQSNSVSVTLTECLFGFVFYNGTQDDCLCSNATVNSHVTCDPDLKVFTVTSGWWFGPGPNEVGTVYHKCLLDYCQSQNSTNLVVTVQPQALDDQCANHHTGLLCGRCQDGYSAVFGTNRCMKCTNSHLGLLVFFAAAGIGIIAIISFLHISISEGYINGVLFYVSVVSSYEIHFTGHFSARWVFIPIYLLNLDMGFETCFYNGMTPLARAGLGLVFPAYLFILMVLFIWLASRSLRLSEWLANSNFTPSKLVATLIVLTYNSITQSCLQILGSVKLSVYQDDGSSIVIRPWATDPNVEYFSPLHTLLFVIAIILVIIFIIPVPILLILPSFTYRGLWRMKPLYDAFFCYYKDQYTFWLGARFILRIVIFVMSSFLQPPLNNLLLGICMALVIFLSSIVHPFKFIVQGALDSFFLANVLLLVTGSLYFQILTVYPLSAENAEMVFVLVVVGVAYVVICGVIVWHLILRFPMLRAVLPCKVKPKNGHTPSFQGSDHGYGTVGGHVQYNFDDDDELGTSTEGPKHMKSKFSEYREPLLEGNSVRLDNLSTRN